MNKTTATTTAETTTNRYPAYRREPATPQPDPRDYPDCMAWTDACIAHKREHLAPMWNMSVEQRIAAMRRGELSMKQLLAWAARFPDEVPLVHGEYEFIAVFTPDVAEADD